MIGTIQDGIYYDKPLGFSFSLIFLKISRSVNSFQLGTDLAELWKMYEKLKKGMVMNLDVAPKHTHHGNLSILLGYGPRIFSGIVSGIKKNMPRELKNEKGFRGPNILRGDSIVEGSNIKFSKDVIKNHAVEEHIVIQFIADNEMITSRAVVETWKHINNMKRPFLNISKLYTGFKRSDHRGWLGFHDGISNMNRDERKEAIVINNSISEQDKWLINGTYMTFIRFIINMEKWESLSLSEQEIIIGRKKITGCPIIGFDKNGIPISDPNCPVKGTNEVIEEGNNQFRVHPNFKGKSLPHYSKDRSLSISHIYRVHKDINYPSSDPRSFRIYRQGFEFLEPSNKLSGFNVGLNFISFQNSPQRIMKILSSQNWLGKPSNVNYYGSRSLEEFVSASAAGLFLIPPLNKEELFPGAVLFL